MRAFIFPGQGSQFIGMGQDLADSFSEAREVFEEVTNRWGSLCRRLCLKDQRNC